jgi:hypothetical protein
VHIRRWRKCALDWWQWEKLSGESGMLIHGCRNHFLTDNGWILVWKGGDSSPVLAPCSKWKLAHPILPHVFWENVAVLQQDGAPAHYARSVRQFLDEMLPGRWIGRGSALPWPPRSPDITSCDNALWGIIRQSISRNKVASVNELKEAITAAFREITLQQLRRISRRTWRRILLCKSNGGQHVEKIDSWEFRSCIDFSTLLLWVIIPNYVMCYHIVAEYK